MKARASHSSCPRAKNGAPTVTDSSDRGLSLQETASITGLAPLTFRKAAVYDGKVSFFKVGSRLVFRRSDVEAFMARCRVPARDGAA